MKGRIRLVAAITFNYLSNRSFIITTLTKGKGKYNVRELEAYGTRFDLLYRACRVLTCDSNLELEGAGSTNDMSSMTKGFQSECNGGHAYVWRRPRRLVVITYAGERRPAPPESGVRKVHSEEACCALIDFVAARN